MSSITENTPTVNPADEQVAAARVADVQAAETKHGDAENKPSNKMSVDAAPEDIASAGKKFQPSESSRIRDSNAMIDAATLAALSAITLGKRASPPPATAKASKAPAVDQSSSTGKAAAEAGSSSDSRSDATHPKQGKSAEIAEWNQMLVDLLTDAKLHKSQVEALAAAEPPQDPLCEAACVSCDAVKADQKMAADIAAADAPFDKDAAAAPSKSAAAPKPVSTAPQAPKPLPKDLRDTMPHNSTRRDGDAANKDDETEVLERDGLPEVVPMDEEKLAAALSALIAEDEDGFDHRASRASKPRRAPDATVVSEPAEGGTTGREKKGAIQKGSTRSEAARTPATIVIDELEPEARDSSSTEPSSNSDDADTVPISDAKPAPDVDADKSVSKDPRQTAGKGGYAAAAKKSPSPDTRFESAPATPHAGASASDRDDDFGTASTSPEDSIEKMRGAYSAPVREACDDAPACTQRDLEDVLHREMAASVRKMAKEIDRVEEKVLKVKQLVGKRTGGADGLDGSREFTRPRYFRNASHWLRGDQSFYERMGGDPDGPSSALKPATWGLEGEYSRDENVERGTDVPTAGADKRCAEPCNPSSVTPLSPAEAFVPAKKGKTRKAKVAAKVAEKQRLPALYALLAKSQGATHDVSNGTCDRVRAEPTEAKQANSDAVGKLEVQNERRLRAVPRTVSGFGTLMIPPLVGEVPLTDAGVPYLDRACDFEHVVRYLAAVRAIALQNGMSHGEEMRLAQRLLRGKGRELVELLHAVGAQPQGLAALARQLGAALSTPAQRADAAKELCAFALPARGIMDQLRAIDAFERDALQSGWQESDAKSVLLKKLPARLADDIKRMVEVGVLNEDMPMAELLAAVRGLLFSTSDRNSYGVELGLRFKMRRGQMKGAQNESEKEMEAGGDDRKGL